MIPGIFPTGGLSPDVHRVQEWCPQVKIHARYCRFELMAREIFFSWLNHTIFLGKKHNIMLEYYNDNKNVMHHHIFR